MIEFNTLEAAQNYILSLFDSATHFQTVYVELDEPSQETKTTLMKCFLRFKSQTYRANNKDQMNFSQKQYYTRNAEKINSKRKLQYENNTQCIGPKRSRYTVSPLQRVERFKLAILEGPYYICVSCNRCLYSRSVISFSDKYHKDNFKPVFYLKKSFNDKYYICKTCDKKLLKQNLPCQSVTNKLEIFDFPTSLPKPNLLERVLLSQRILFTKVKVMPK